MKAITLHQPWAQLMVTRRPCDCGAEDPDIINAWEGNPPPCTCRRMVKEIETRGWAAPKALIGQRIAIHAAARRAITGVLTPNVVVIGAYLLVDKHRGAPRMPLGAVVGSGVLTACVEMVEWGDMPETGPFILLRYDRARQLLAAELHDGEGFAQDVTDQVPFGHFEPGRWAWLFADAVKLDEPIPCKGRQGIWNLPEEVERALGL